MGAGKTSAADRVKGAGAAGGAAGAIAPRQFRSIDPGQALAIDITDGRREFAAGVDLSVREEAYEIKGSAASMARTAAEGRITPVPADDVDEIILEAHDGIGACRIEISFKK